MNPKGCNKTRWVPLGNMKNRWMTQKVENRWIKNRSIAKQMVPFEKPKTDE
jgi:predicted P-loop ATPase